jgi:hypothetical protein
MSGANEQDGLTEFDEEAVDLDLKVDDVRLREAVGQPTTVRIDGKVIHIVHVAEWPGSAIRASSVGDWATWATETILDDEERNTFLDADLLAYQLEAVFELCAKKGNVKPGKSRRSRR